MAQGGARARVLIGLQRRDAQRHGGAAGLIEALDVPQAHRRGPIAGEGLHREGFAHRAQGNAHQQQGFAFDVDDPAAVRDPAIGGATHVDEEKDGHVAARALL
ncbi:hypothetical protein D9M68_876650 [compost metagenome]